MKAAISASMPATSLPVMQASSYWMENREHEITSQRTVQHPAHSLRAPFGSQAAPAQSLGPNAKRIARRASLMAKGKRRDSEGQYIILPYAQLKSEAWRSLSGAAVKVWLELHTRFNGGNNGNVRLSMNEAVSALGISKGTAQRAFVELEEKGFIALHNPGNWYHRKAHEWLPTTKRMQTRSGTQLATNDWRHWRKKQKKVRLSTRRLCRWDHHETQSPPLGPPENPSDPFRRGAWVLRWDTNTNHSQGSNLTGTIQPKSLRAALLK